MSKVQRLAQLLTAGGKIAIAAIDHRGSLANYLHPEKPEETTDREMRDWKKRMIELYHDMVSGVLIDPIFGKELVKTSEKFGWILSMEKTGYRGGKEARETELLPNWSVVQAKEMGASGVKLLLYYDPENKELCRKQREVAKRVGEECIKEGIVFLLEPLTYRKSSDPYNVERVVDDLSDLPVDIFKLEYPGSYEKCERISNKLTVPWVLLSAGADYERFKEWLKISCQAGAAGMAVGRAAWQEFGRYEGSEREKFLLEVATPRMKELVTIVETYGKRVA